MRTKSQVLLALLAVLALVLSACGGDDASSETTAAGETVTTTAEETTTSAAEETTTTAAAEPAGSLLIWADELKVEPLQAIAPAFTEATGVEVEVQLVPFGEIREQVNLAGPAGEGPDIFAGAHDWTGELAANGIVEPIDLGAKRDQFLEVAVNAFGYEGQTYGVPYVTEAIALYYNTDLVSEPPATFDELSAACDAAGTPECLVLPGGGAATDAYHNYPLISEYGATIFAYDADTGSYDPAEVTIDSPEAIEAGQYLDTLIADGVVASTDDPTAKELFLAGDAPFWISGPWQLGELREQDAVNWDVALIPQYGDHAAQPFVGAQGFFLSAFSENTLLAQSFLLDFIATDETMQALYDADPRGTAWTAVQEGLAADPQVQTFAASAANGVPMPNIPEMGSVWGPLGDNMLLVRNGELPAEDALKTAAEAIRAAIAG